MFYFLLDVCSFFVFLLRVMHIVFLANTGLQLYPNKLALRHRYATDCVFRFRSTTIFFKVVNICVALCVVEYDSLYYAFSFDFFLFAVGHLFFDCFISILVRSSTRRKYPITAYG